MKKQTLLLRLFSSYIALALVAITLTLIFASRAIESFYFDQSYSNLDARSILVRGIISRSPFLDRDALDSLCVALGEETQTRITLVQPEGTVLADSEEDPSTMDLHNDRPEILDAMRLGEGMSRRGSYTLSEEHLYFARMGEFQGEPIIVRVSFTTSDISAALNQLKRTFVLSGLAIVLLIAVLNWYLSRQIIKPIRVMEAGARRFAKGKLKLKVPVSGIAELGSLANSLNQMAEEIFDRIRTVTQQKNEQIAILSSMTEGVIALDPDSRILSLNKASEEMFNIRAKQATGRPFFEVIRHAELIDFVNLTLGKKRSQQIRIELYDPELRFLNVIGSRMPSKKGAMGGAVIVFTDLTRIQKLEGVRREFVANVSHELKTPITSIQGFVETLQDGAINDPQHAQKFLDIISKHSLRLGQIVDDLLELSRIEELSEEEQSFPLVKLDVLVRSCVQGFEQSAHARDIKTDLDLDESIELELNSKLMEHALGNLLDNAVKYADRGTSITVRTFSKKKQVMLEVQDQGPGIEDEHLERIFERFYRVDKGRSREVGGTGLGLSIVKHIARVHHADVEVESEVGKGTTFRLIFPTK